MNYTFEINIDHIKICDYYFSFFYKIKKNGTLITTGTYEGDHVYINEKEKFDKILKDGYACELALNQISCTF